MNLSVIILTKNSETSLKKTLESIKWASEILLIDDFSTDETCNIAKSYGAKIFKKHLNNNFSNQRNYGLQKARNNWVLYVDSDEVVSPELKISINKTVIEDKNDGIYINRQDIWKGKKLAGGEWGNIKLLRLGKKDKGKWKRAVHEYWDIENAQKVLKGNLYHYPHLSISDFLSHIEYHSRIHSKEINREGKNVHLWKVFVFPIAKFFYNYVLKLGFKDGTRGFIYSCMMSYHSFISWSILWIKKRNS